MRATRRTGRAVGTAALAVLIAGTGVGVGALVAEPSAEGSPTAAAPSASPGTAAPAGAAQRTSYAPVIRQVVPSVVLIKTDAGLGSGVIFDNKGNIVTNAHVAGDATSFRVQLADDPTPRTARLVGSYQPDDIAVIRVDNPDGLKPARFGDSAKAAVGDVVLAVGNPLGLSSSVTEGIVSATGRVVTGSAGEGTPAATLPGAIQTSAPINPGNSGGALVNMSGSVIGIPTLAAASPQTGAQAQGIGFAIPSNLVRDIAGQIISSGKVTDSHRAALGVQIGTLAGSGGEPAGVDVIAVTPGGPADRAGLRAGDVIRSVAGTPTPSAGALAEALAGQRPGSEVTVTVTRDQQSVSVKVTLGQLPGG